MSEFPKWSGNKNLPPGWTVVRVDPSACQEPTAAPAQEDILEEALRLTSGDRNNQYGPPDADFKRTASMWSALFGRTFTSHEVALAMICLKLSRLSWSEDKRDSWVDVAGYARCGWMCVEAGLGVEARDA